MPASTLGRRPVPLVLCGALAISFSGILYRYADVSPTTGAFFRCVWALPVLWLLARLEDRRYGPREWRSRRLAWIAGAFFAADLILWHHSIEQVGAGLATVLGNTQVVLVALLAWAVLGERPPRAALAAIPVVGVGVILISGVLEDGAYGVNPTLGALFGVLTGVAYSGFLLTLREGSSDLRRAAGPLLRRDAGFGGRMRALGRGRGRPRPEARAVAHRVADRARAQLAGLRLAADHDHAAQAAGSAQLGHADVPAALLGRLRRDPARRVALERRSSWALGASSRAS